MPEDPSEVAVRETFARQRFMSMIGAKPGRVAAGEAEIELPFSDRIGQQTGVVHAGVIAAIADSACGGAALTLMPPGSDVVSVEFKLNLLAPARGERFVARARVLRAGKTLTVCRADVIAIADGEETLVATMLGTMMRR
ncbi:MAG TPA: PaaI family thioesterase [Thermoanaerobaculia bacterium]|jgi:uncharacterized protein (TIGR00369 family)|nr:PaaI family thioesterase [Thermoanaerobaculia bacterium]